MAAAAANGGGGGPPTGLRFVPLLGVHGRGPLSYLLELEGFTFLLDCGWNDAYDPQLLAPVLAALPRIDAGEHAPPPIYAVVQQQHPPARLRRTCVPAPPRRLIPSSVALDAVRLGPEYPLALAVPPIRAVLLSHSDLAHLGALPYLVGRCGLTAPVYATTPVHKMGQMAMYDQYLAQQVGA